MRGGVFEGGMNVSVRATGDSFGGAGAKGYSWTTKRRGAVVWNHPNSGVTLYVLWHDSSTSPTAALTKADEVLSPGDSSIWEGDVKQLGIYSDGAATLGTNFDVRGWL